METPRADEFKERLKALDRGAAEHLALEVFGRGGASALSEGLLVPALEALGGDWELGDASLAEVYMAGRICEEIVNSLIGDVPAPSAEAGRLAIASLDDPHLLGKRIVRSVLRAAGYSVTDYGRASSEELVERAASDRLDVLLISTLMLPSALRVRGVVDGLCAAGARTRVVVGGAPFRFDPNLGAEVGADGAGRTAADAVTLVRRFVAEGGE